MKSQALWSVILQFSRFGANAVVFLVMARFLTLAELGAFALAFAPVRWLQVLHKSGVVDSVVIANKSDDEGTSQIIDALFVLSVAVGLLVSVALFAFAFVADMVFDSEQPLAGLMAALSLIPLVYGLSSVSEGMLRKELNFRRLALNTLLVQVLAAVVAFSLAFLDQGAWSLAGFALVNAIAGAVVTVVATPWRPRSLPPLALVRSLVPSYAAICGRVLVSGSVHPLLQIAVGLALGLEAAGAFQIAQRFYTLLDALSLAPIRYLVLPLFAKSATRSEKLESGVVLKALQISGLISAPVYTGSIGVAPALLLFVVGGENATTSLLPLQLFCMLGFSAATSTIINQALIAIKRPGLAFRRSVMVLVGTAILTFPALALSLEATTLAFVIASMGVLAFVYTILPDLFDISPRSAIAATGWPYLASFVAVLPVWLLGEWMLDGGSHPGLVLLAQALALPVLYLPAILLIAPSATKALRTALKR